MIKVAAITAGRDVPSTRFRIRQHIDPLLQYGIAVSEYMPCIDKYSPLPGWPQGVSYKYALPYLALWQGCKLTARLPGLLGSWRTTITWLEREILPGYLTLEPRLKHPMVMDVDDSIWLSKPFGQKAVARAAKSAEVVVAGNTFLADWFTKYNNQVRIVPTAVDLDRYLPRPQAIRDHSAKFVIGWTGTAGNLKYLYEIEAPMHQFLKDHASAELLVVSDQPPVFKALPTERIRFKRWAPGIEADSIQEMDVGIMPLPDDEWTRGKCSFKMLQYMACALPVIVSPVGMNADVLAMGELGIGVDSDASWYESFELLYSDADLARRFGYTGRAVVEATFSRVVVAKQLADIFKGLV